MIRRIVIENFMSHRHTVIEPAEGLTVLSGPNNCGKSAVVVALQTLCENDNRAKVFLRHGAKEARVFVSTDEGHQIEWRRPCGGSAYYILDGKRIDRLGQGVPDDLHEMLRLPRVVDDKGEAFDVHFADQKSPIFLLNAGGGRAATFFASSSDAGLLIRMQAKHRQNVEAAVREQRLVSTEVSEAKERLKRFDGLGELDEKARRASDQHLALKTAIEDARNLGGAIRSIEDTAFAANREQRTLAVSTTLSAVPAMSDPTPLRGHLEQLSEAREARSGAEHKLASLKALEAAPVLHNTALLASVCDGLSLVSHQLVAHQRESSALSVAAEPPTLQPDEPLRALASEIERGTAAIRRIRRRLDLLTALAEPAPLRDASGIMTDIAEVERATARQIETRAQVEASKAALEALRDDIRAFVQRNPHCPTCGQALDPEALADTMGGHAHA